MPTTKKSKDATAPSRGLAQQLSDVPGIQKVVMPHGDESDVPAHAGPRHREAADEGNDADASGSDASSSLSDRDENGPAPGHRWERPTGTTRDAYQGWREWSERRWAWEFLRRNEDFQAKCKAARCGIHSKAAQKKLALDFHLKQFKDFDESYDVDARVGFRVSIRSIPRRDDFLKNLKSTPPRPPREVTTQLHRNEVMIKFRLEPVRSAQTTALKLQLAQAKKRLKAFAKLLREVEKPSGRGKGLTAHEINAEKLLEELMVLDLEFDGKLAVEFPRLLFEARNPGSFSLRLSTDPKKNSDKGTDILSRAKDRAEWGYLSIALLRKPKGKKKAKA